MMMSQDILLILEIVIFVFCLGISACFSGSETALTSMSKLRVKRLFGENEELFYKLEAWLKEPNRFLATILIGNNFVNTLSAVLAANICDQILSQWFDLSNPYAFGSALAVGVTTFLLLVFGEIVPKTYCKDHAVRISQLAIGPLEFMYKILRPFIGFFVFISNLFISLMGTPKIKEVPLLTEDDVRTLIELSEKEGVLEEEEREMIHSIIDFGDTLVKEIMTPRVDFHVIPAHLTFEEVRREAVSQGHSRIPVYEEDPDQIIGILYVKDLLNEQNGGENFDLKKMLRPALFVPKSKRVSDLLETFRKEKNHMAIVVDEYGTTAGLVTIEDVLEEIVGDIQDEYDEEPPEYERQEDGTIEADAKINLDILTEILKIEFPEDDVESLGGFMISVLGDVPPVGAQVDYRDHLFTVMDADERRINRVKIEHHPKEEEKEESADPPPALGKEQNSYENF
ncbi:MAG: HlyC/CorC family transporter [Candidatus Omnitrophica bacterium]|nr:HlyC/CorC family transporter [Candidatus Omnitrophota bacterium]